jgi:hypothetical protein
VIKNSNSRNSSPIHAAKRIPDSSRIAFEYWSSQNIGPQKLPKGMKKHCYKRLITTHQTLTLKLQTSQKHCINFNSKHPLHSKRSKYTIFTTFYKSCPPIRQLDGMAFHTSIGNSSLSQSNDIYSQTSITLSQQEIYQPLSATPWSSQFRNPQQTQNHVQYPYFPQ